MPRQPRGPECSFHDCTFPVVAKDLCTGHYQQRAKGKPLTELRPRWRASERDERGYKRCRKCHEWQPENSYNRKSDCRDGLMTICKTCHVDRELRRIYGISLRQYEEMLEAQGGGCAICGRLNSDGRMLAVDHDHSCCPIEDGKQARKTCGTCVRGLLCSVCNLHLGSVGDSIEHLEAMITYLRASKGVAKQAAEEQALRSGDTSV